MLLVPKDFRHGPDRQRQPLSMQQHPPVRSQPPWQPGCEQPYCPDGCPFFRLPSICVADQPEGLSKRTLTCCNRPVFLSLTRRDSVSANLAPAVNDCCTDWRTCRPDQTNLLPEILFSVLDATCRSKSQSGLKTGFPDTSARFSGSGTRRSGLHLLPCS